MTLKIKAEVTSEDGIHWEIEKVLYVTNKGRVTIECYKIMEQLKGKNLVDSLSATSTPSS